MSYELRRATAAHLVLLMLLGLYEWTNIEATLPFRWPVSGIIWLVPFLWLLRSPGLAIDARKLPLAPLLTWCCWYLIATNWSAEQRPAIAFCLGLLTTVLAGYWFTATYGWQRFARIAAFTIGLFLVVGLLYRMAAGPLLEKGRFAGIGNNPTDTGRHAAMMVVLGWGAFVGRRQWQALFILGGVGFAAFAIAKTALVGLVAAGAYLAYRSSSRYEKSRLLAAGAASFVILVAAIGLSTGAAEPSLAEDGTSSALTLTGRSLVWEHTLEEIRGRPIVGHGTGSSRSIFGAMITDGDLSWRVTNAHNLWLQSQLEHGILGISLLIAFFVSLVSRCRKRPEPSRDALLILLAVNSMTEVLVQFPSLELLMIAAAAGSVSSERLTDAEFGSPALVGTTT